ncbi:hypothetical protein Nepgr_006161 [Nepenthes gracilis]|uniref:Uncharacterized protein n=1 Tax=Nepenthes gracilis TaxID=150966 RepID=A0AAD3S547_NEPGR|nr:hypothetical protein Nepgr_006161 [Nepenthes gracilis]
MSCGVDLHVTADLVLEHLVDRPASMKLSGSCLPWSQPSRVYSGKGKLSLGQALLTSVKSTHILHFPLFFFFTSTTLESRSGYWTSLMNLRQASLFHLLSDGDKFFDGVVSPFLPDRFDRDQGPTCGPLSRRDPAYQPVSKQKGAFAREKMIGSRSWPRE